MNVFRRGLSRALFSAALAAGLPLLAGCLVFGNPVKEGSLGSALGLTDSNGTASIASSLSYSRSVSSTPRGTASVPKEPSVSGSGLNFTIAPALPAGMSIDASTGVISGTPTADTPTAPATTTYTVTMTYSSGEVLTASVRILVMNGYRVDSTGTAVDANVADGVCATAGGVCTLTAAINQAVHTGGDLIITIGDGNYSQPELIADGQAGGRIADLTTLVIDGESRDNTVLSANTNARHFTGQNGVNLTFSNLTLQNGNSPTNAGAIDFGGGGVLTIDTVTLKNNTTATHAGAVNVSSGSLVVRNSTFDTNTATNNEGGAIHSDGSSISIADSVFTGNHSDDEGGAIVKHGGNLTITGSVFRNNSANWVGGAVFFDDYGANNTMTIDHSTFEGNSSTTEGGGVYLVTNGTSASISSSSFLNNTSATAGGGIYLDSAASATLTNLTVVGNSSNGPAGGGIRVWAGNHTLIHSTVSGNTTTGSGAGIAVNAGSLSMRFSIIAGNTNSGGIDNCAGPGTLTSVEYNLIDSALGTCGAASGTDLSAAPLLASSTSGDLVKTLALLPGSMAIDRIPSGSCAVATDARDAVRPSGAGCDVGAFEL